MSSTIVTGGNTGIGRATCVALAADGFDVGLVWHDDEERLHSAVAECEARGAHVEARWADLRRLPEAPM